MSDLIDKLKVRKAIIYNETLKQKFPSGIGANTTGYVTIPINMGDANIICAEFMTDQIELSKGLDIQVVYMANNILAATYRTTTAVSATVFNSAGTKIEIMYQTL